MFVRPTPFNLRRTVRWIALSVIAWVVVSTSRGDSILSLGFTLAYATSQEAPNTTGYSGFPILQALPDPRPTRTEVDSLQGDYLGILEAGQNFGTAGSTIYSSFDDFRDSFGNSLWRLTLDSWTPTPTDYFFNVDASALEDFGTVPVTIAGNLQGTSFAAGTQPTFTWSGPRAFDSITFSLSRDDLDAPPVELVTLDSTSTSHMLQMPLTPGHYNLEIIYNRDVTALSPLTATTPMKNGQPVADWGGLVRVGEEVEDNVTFTVVPEPATLSLLGTGVVVLRFARKRRS